MTTAALWTKHRNLAHAIARTYRLPGAEAQDVEQEALIGLWVAARSFKPGRGTSFPTFARVVVKRRLSTLLKSALAEKNAVLTNADRDDLLLTDGVDVERVVVARDTLARLVAAVADLTPLERFGLEAAVNGEAHGNLLENAAYRARRKLKAAA